MDIKFNCIGLNFEADVSFGEDEEEFYSLTCEGQDASFLCESTVWPDIVAAAWRAAIEEEFKLKDEAALERFILEREETP